MQENAPNHDDRDDRFQTRSGVSMKRVYTPEDVKEAPYSTEIGEPGRFPYTRGPYPGMYRTAAWMKRQPMGFGSSELTAERYSALHKKGGQADHTGAPAITLLFDMPTNYGYDSDHQLPAGEIIARVDFTIELL